MYIEDNMASFPLLNLIGTWNAIPNTPTLVDGVGTSNDCYVIANYGPGLPLSGYMIFDRNLGSGMKSWPSQMYIYYNSGVWDLAGFPSSGGGIFTINGDGSTNQTLTTGISGTDFAIVDNGTGDHKFNLPVASAVNTGKLSNTDWSTFNSKQTALTLGNLTEAISNVLTLSGNTGAVIGSGLTVQVKQASTSQSGYLSSTDWNTFHSKESVLTFTSGTTRVANVVSNDLITGKAGGQTETFGTGTTDVGTFKQTTGNSTTGTAFIFVGGNNGATEFMRILVNGNIGIGTAGPTTTLSIVGTGNFTSAVAAAIMNLVNGSTGATLINLTSAGTSYGTVQNDASDTWSLGHHTTLGVTLGTPTLTWNASDHVMIGTTIDNGVDRLQVNGSVSTGIPGSTLGKVKLNGSTSGTVTVQSKAIGGTWSLTVPDTAGTNGYALITDGTGITSWGVIATGTVTSVSGTSNRITSTGGATPVIDIAATYIGQTSITTLGTITGTAAWNATKVGVLYGGTNADLSATGGTSQVLKQASTGAAVTVGQLSLADLSNFTALTSFTPSPVGFTGAVTVNVANYQKIGNLVTVHIDVTGTSGGASGTIFTFTLPVTSHNSQDQWINGGQGTNTGTIDTANYTFLQVTSNSTTCNVRRGPNPAANAWTASGTKSLKVTFSYISV